MLLSVDHPSVELRSADFAGPTSTFATAPWKTLNNKMNTAGGSGAAIVARPSALKKSSPAGDNGTLIKPLGTPAKQQQHSRVQWKPPQRAFNDIPRPYQFASPSPFKP